MSSEEKHIEKSFFKRLLSVIAPWRPPDTTEELESEIQELLEDGEEQGLISELEEQMIKSIFDFRDTTAAEIMTPAANIVSHDLDQPIKELIEVVIDQGFTRIPIYQGNPDTISGILHAKDLLRICHKHSEEEVDLRSFLIPAYLISESKPIVDLLREFQKRKIHMAMVTDEFGAIRGLITLEDILEEIVGEIDDEYDVEERSIEELDDSSVRVKGIVDVEEVEERFGVDLPDGPYESIAGMLIHRLGRLGAAGDQINIESLRFTVDTATPRQIKWVVITRLNNGEED